MAMQVSYSICTEVPETSNLRKDKGRYRKNTAGIERTKVSSSIGSGGVSGSHPYARGDTAASECVTVYGMFEK